MADFEGALPIRTARDDDVKVKLVDFAGGDPATAGLKIESDGSVNARITDGTNTLAVNADGSANTVSKISDGTDTLEINTDGSLNAVVKVSDGTDTMSVNTDGSVNTLTKITDGTDTLEINTDGSLNVSVTAAGTKVVYPDTATLAANATETFDYVVTSGKTFQGDLVLVGGEGKTKVEFGTWNGTLFTSKGVYFQQPAMNTPVPLPSLELLGDGTAAIRVLVTNKDKASSDVYLSLQGREV